MTETQTVLRMGAAERVAEAARELMDWVQETRDLPAVEGTLVDYVFRSMLANSHAVKLHYALREWARECGE